MNDPLIALGSILGVALLVLLNRLLGGFTRANLSDPAAAIGRWHEDYWDDRVRDILFDRRGGAALLICEGEAPGLIVARGDGFVTRRLSAGLLRSLSRPRPDRLALGLADLSLPRVSLEATPDAIDSFLAKSGLEITTPSGEAALPARG